MATIRKRGDSYQIRVSCGYTTDGKQVEQSLTWKPDKNMTQKQIEKELNRRAVIFEEECLNGQTTASMKFEEFAQKWFEEYANIKLKTQTVRGYRALEGRIYKHLGHLRMDKITPRHIQKFINTLHKEKCQNSHGKAGKTLSTKTIKLHIGLVSSIFEYAVKLQYVSSNPCHNVVFPASDKKEVEIYSIDEIKKLMALFDKEPECNFKYIVFFKLALYTGFRRGELLGLEWKDFDWDKGIVSVKRTSMWTKEKGVYTDTPKTKTSFRSLRLPTDAINLLMQYKEWQGKQKIMLGSKWIETDRLFTQAEGKPMNPASPYKFYEEFCKRTGMRFVSPHKFRHLNASMLIAQGVDVKTVQTCLGHSSPTTTLSIYTHAFQETQATAVNAISNAIKF